MSYYHNVLMYGVRKSKIFFDSFQKSLKAAIVSQVIVLARTFRQELDNSGHR